MDKNWVDSGFCKFKKGMHDLIDYFGLPEIICNEIDLIQTIRVPVPAGLMLNSGIVRRTNIILS